jgi:hypothetical protein
MLQHTLDLNHMLDYVTGIGQFTCTPYSSCCVADSAMLPFSAPLLGKQHLETSWWDQVSHLVGSGLTLDLIIITQERCG